MLKPAIQRPTKKHVIVFRHRCRVEFCSQVNVNIFVIEHTLHHDGVTFDWHPLKTMTEVVVIVVKSNWQPLQDGSRQLTWWQAPLLDRITAKKSMVQIFPEKTQCLILKASNLGNRFFC
ncbi:hypothetical protein BVI2075_970056 [Burkholderia vietnamiensis]|nr:hypothetical protein BVI2075_970056 [Burkholderia vietnamiensis]